MAEILAGRAPLVSGQAAREFLQRGSGAALREFLVANQGRLARAVPSNTAAMLRAQAGVMRRVLGRGDSFVAASAMLEGLTLFTRDGRLGRFLDAPLGGRRKGSDNEPFQRSQSPRRMPSLCDADDPGAIPLRTGLAA